MYEFREQLKNNGKAEADPEEEKSKIAEQMIKLKSQKIEISKIDEIPSTRKLQKLESRNTIHQLE